MAITGWREFPAFVAGAFRYGFSPAPSGLQPGIAVVGFGDWGLPCPDAGLYQLRRGFML